MSPASVFVAASCLLVSLWVCWGWCGEELAAAAGGPRRLYRSWWILEEYCRRRDAAKTGLPLLLACWSSRAEVVDFPSAFQSSCRIQSLVAARERRQRKRRRAGCPRWLERWFGSPGIWLLFLILLGCSVSLSGDNIILRSSRKKKKKKAYPGEEDEHLEGQPIQQICLSLGMH